jgi:predicted type IV restriction endonuclease
MRRVVAAGLTIIIAVFLWGCGLSAAENQERLMSRVNEYHSFLLNINDPQKAAENEYALRLVDYLDPLDRYEARYQAVFLQHEWLQRNLRAQKYRQQNYIEVESIAIEEDGRSALVKVTVSRRNGPANRMEKWTRIDNTWYRMVEHSF